VRIGIDVGGTNTDAVVMDGRRLVTAFKTPTTPDVLSGIEAALAGVLREVSPERIRAVMLGTTHFANALAEERRLAPVAVVRLARPSGEGIPPFADWPESLARKVEGKVFQLHGGYEFDGREIAPFDPAEVMEVAREIRRAGLKVAAVSAVFSPVRDDMERRTAEILRAEVPGLEVTLSADIGSIGLLERENAAILNATLLPLAEEIVAAFGDAIRRLGLTCPFSFTQNDGTLMSAAYARRFPVRTISSGPTNSMRGAAYLSGLDEAVVVDIGGTTTDVGVLVGGFPRPAARTVSLAGVRTNFRMPDVVSVALGGGSRVDAENRRVGPESVGYRLTSEAFVFGGRTLTATDVAVMAGRAHLGDPARVPLDEGAAQEILAGMDARLATVVDRMKPGREPLPVVVVGGGAILAPSHLPGATAVVRPPHHDVANAIGAAIAQVGGEVDRVYDLEGRTRADVLAEARALAARRAVEAGARPDSVQVVDLEEVPLTYLPSRAARLRVKAVGELEEVP
jgi:N-methylhydantoinase A/oxoprolinase/acetone carboxylase beta subunit